MITISQVKNIGNKLTGLIITASEYQDTGFYYNTVKAWSININKKQLLYTLIKK